MGGYIFSVVCSSHISLNWSSSNVHYHIFSLFLGTLMHMRDRKRKMRDATLKTDSNPVYATYQDDSEPIAEVFCYFFLLQGF